MPQSPTSPTSPTASGPSSVRAIVNWLETSGASTGGSKGANATVKAVTGRLSHTRAKETAAPSPASPPVLPVSKLSIPPSVVVSPPSSKSNAVQPPSEPAQPHRPPTTSPSPSLSPPTLPQTKPTEDYSKTLLRYQAFISQAQSKGGAGEAAAVRSVLGKKKSYGDLGRRPRTADGPVKCPVSTANSGRYERDKTDVDAYWASVRAQLTIGDEEIYGSS